jgi:hypothetical protein
MKPSKKKTPVVLCRVIPPKPGRAGHGWLLQFWCPFCRHLHMHGGGDGPEPDLEHRVAHCTVPDSPFKPGGYMLAWDHRLDRQESQETSK